MQWQQGHVILWTSSIRHFFGALAVHGMLGWGMDEKRMVCSVAGGLRGKRQAGKARSNPGKFVALFLAGSGRQAFTERMMGMPEFVRTVQYSTYGWVQEKILILNWWNRDISADAQTIPLFWIKVTGVRACYIMSHHHCPINTRSPSTKRPFLF